MGTLRDLGKKYGPTAESPQEEVMPADTHDNAPSPEVSVASHEADTEQNPENTHSNSITAKKLMGMSWIRINKIVLEKKNTLLDTLSVLYTALHDCADTIALVLKKEKGGLVSLHLGVRDMSAKRNFVSKYLLQRGLFGCLPGISYDEEQLSLNASSTPYVSYCTGIPSLKNDKKDGFVQGIERLVNSTANIPTFSIVIIAENVNGQDCAAKRKELQDKYSKLSELAEETTTHSENNGEQKSSTYTKGSSTTSSKSSSTGNNSSTTKNDSQSTSEGRGAAIGISVNSNTSRTEGSSHTTGDSNTETSSSSQANNESKATTHGCNSSKGTSVQTKKENKEIKDELKLLELQIERIANAGSIGMWNYSAYFLADSQTSSYILACIYRGLICSEKSEKSSFSISTLNEKVAPDALHAISDFTHPVLHTEPGEAPAVRCSMVDSFELSIGMPLPLTSIPGVLVREQASFGRNITGNSAAPEYVIPLGNISHLGIAEKDNHVGLDANLLTSHMFVTGATGSGKSNAIYGVVDSLLQKGVKCLVIEPAKGEYKNVFGGREDFHVLGTNPNLMPLLKINPFSFPAGIHVEEHIERLIDIFNACWPMYAAMPAVLKESICRAYKSCGWDLVNSESDYGLYPTFEDVEHELNGYINETEYSSDSKGDYKGALCTRLQSLSNGIVGKIFSGREYSSEELFESNTIIDLSRVGSAETKSLIMGILLIKLNEYRMSENVGMNLPPRHATVLEEAHNLLRATSTAQAQESSNLTGKSVEMITSAIAEMRTYGECFIIADQSPSLLDKAAISNTNTKIIMNLPSQEDMRIAAASIGLTDQQEKELSRQKTGVAVVYQKGWEEPVQCQIAYFDECTPYAYSAAPAESTERRAVMQLLLKAYTTSSELRRGELAEMLATLDLASYRKVMIMKILSDDRSLEEELCAKMLFALIGEQLLAKASKLNDIKLFNSFITSGIKKLGDIELENAGTFLDMYVKGCSLMNNTAFYDNWLIKKAATN